MCTQAAINNGWIIRGGTYDEVKHDFVDTDEFCISLAVKGELGRLQTIKLGIKYCPICGEKLGSK